MSLITVAYRLDRLWNRHLPFDSDPHAADERLATKNRRVLPPPPHLLARSRVYSATSVESSSACSNCLSQ